MIGAIPIIAENRNRESMECGEFERLEGAGKPWDDVDGQYDPDWWLKRMSKREQLTEAEATSIA